MDPMPVSPADVVAFTGQHDPVTVQRDRDVKENLPGRVDNTTLPPSRPLLPLFDAIVNAIHAIEDGRALRKDKGRITITVCRDETQDRIEGSSGDVSDEPVTGFDVADNGIGFNDANLESFNTADTQYKKSRGSKGIGRLLWLKAFGDIHIDSVYHPATGGPKRRTFSFRLPDGIADMQSSDAPEGRERGTTVSLRGYAATYKDRCPKSIDSIADHIIDHCLVYLVRGDAPQIILCDKDKSLSINERRSQYLSTVALEPEPITVKGHALSVQHFHVRAKSARSRVHYIANLREVFSEPPSDPDLNQRLPADDGSTFALVSYVSGGLLDSHLNPERTGFTLPTRGETVFRDDVTLEDVKEATALNIERHAAPILRPLREKKVQHYTEVVHTQLPQYRPLVARHRDQLGGLPPGLSPDKLDVELHRMRARYAAETKEKVRKLITATDYESYDERLDEVLTSLTDEGKAALIESVVHRRLVLEILVKQLQRRGQPDAGYRLEEDIHRVIFPMKTTSDDVAFEDQNLWIIDEKLTYHRYLASDKRLDEMDVIASEEKDRPDIIIWNNPLALSEEPGQTPYSSIVVIEFKRPMRAYSAKEETPTEQVMRYVHKIIQEKAIDRLGRPVKVHDATPFYAYVLVDLTPTLVERLENSGFVKTPDQGGFYLYIQARRTWIEVVSYDKVVNDARKRNRALFDALGLSTV